MQSVDLVKVTRFVRLSYQSIVTIKEVRWMYFDGKIRIWSVSTVQSKWTELNHPQPAAAGAWPHPERGERRGHRRSRGRQHECCRPRRCYHPSGCPCSSVHFDWTASGTPSGHHTRCAGHPKRPQEHPSVTSVSCAMSGHAPAAQCLCVLDPAPELGQSQPITGGQWTSPGGQGLWTT